MRDELHTRIHIDAAPDVAWQVHTDLDAYETWNPFITSSAGRVAAGENLAVNAQAELIAAH